MQQHNEGEKELAPEEAVKRVSGGCKREGGEFSSIGCCAVVVEMARAPLFGSETRKLVLVAAMGPSPVKDQATLSYCDPLNP